jgi:hypothetical protein
MSTILTFGLDFICDISYKFSIMKCKFRFAYIYLVSAAVLSVHTLDSMSNAATAPPATLKYFGFVGVDCGISDPINTRADVNYIDEVSPFSNIAHLCALNPNEYIIQRMATMINRDVLPILDVSNLLFTKVGAKLVLRADYRSRMLAFISANKLARYQKYIGALYIVDEPFWNGLEYISLEAAVNFVKSVLPTPPIMFIEAYPSLDQLKVPANVSIVGFDQYQVDPLLDNYKNNLTKLKTKLGLGQRAMLVMDGEWTADPPGSSFPKESYEANMPHYYTLAQSDPMIIGMLVYIWPGGVSSSNEYGVRNFPASTLEIYRSIGRSISRKP